MAQSLGRRFKGHENEVLRDIEVMGKTRTMDKWGVKTDTAFDNWVEDEFKIFEQEKNKSLDIQFIKKKSPPVKNNNVVVNVRNQYNELLPFYVIPIGGVPKYDYRIGADRDLTK